MLATKLTAMTLGVYINFALTGAQGWPQPETIKGTIPNNDKAQTLDPTLIRRTSDKKLFLYTTGTNGSVWTAESLYGPWTFEGSAKLPEYGGAPSIHKVDDTYYMYYNNHEFDYSSIGVDNPEAATWAHGANLQAASSKTLEVDSWEQHGRLEIEWRMQYNILDADLVEVAGGEGDARRLLLNFGSYQQGLYQMPMADPPVRIASGANGRQTHLANNQTDSALFPTGPTEAPFVYKRGKWYYLFFSSGRCCKQQNSGEWVGRGDVYKVMVCRSEQPGTGFVDRRGVSCADDSGGSIVLGTHDNIWAPGGQGIMEDDEAGGPLMYYHYVPLDEETKKPRDAFYFGWNKLSFEDGWPSVVAPS
ncbi:glycoside hydrolase family 43 protein [Xylariomycetidae sp. FL2044]|nr:glycoside hydrolase family 43 protein [Xylariomycetidae sp. FL2044]